MAQYPRISGGFQAEITFLILEMYRPHQRGVILVGTAGSERITVGTRVSVAGTHLTVEVVAVDMPTSDAPADRLALVVSPDLGECLVAGVELTVEQE